MKGDWGASEGLLVAAFAVKCGHDCGGKQHGKEGESKDEIAHGKELPPHPFGRFGRPMALWLAAICTLGKVASE